MNRRRRAGAHCVESMSCACHGGGHSQRERPARPVPFPGTLAATGPVNEPAAVIVPRVPAPAPIANFEGLDFATWGAGHPPDTNGDVGPEHYIQTVNTSIGIYRKVDGVRL